MPRVVVLLVVLLFGNNSVYFINFLYLTTFNPFQLVSVLVWLDLGPQSFILLLSIYDLIFYGKLGLYGGYQRLSFPERWS